MYFAFVIRCTSGQCWPYKVYDDIEGRALKRARTYGKSLGTVAKIHKVGTCDGDYDASAHLFERACRRAETLKKRYSKQDEKTIDDEKI